MTHHPEHHFSRRNFLRLSFRFGIGAGLLTACGGYFPARLLAATSGAAVSVPHPMSAAQAEVLMAQFQGLCQGAQAWLSQTVGAKEASAIARDCPARFAALLPAVPDIGPGNRNQESLMEAVELTAITQAMRARDLPAAMAGRLLYDLCAREMEELPAAQQRAKGQAMFTPEGRAALAAWAKGTQARRHPGDWVATAVFGDGPSSAAGFDVGYDYAECGAVKFFRAHGVAEVAPYFCLNDFLFSRAQGTGLTRVHTIGQGDALCDFRYTRGGAVTQSWETEAPRFASKAG